MQPIFSMIPGAAQSPVTGVREPRIVQRPEEPSQERPKKPAMDEYIPEEKPEPSGRYWLDRDGDGTPKIRFDDPARAAEPPEQADGADAPEGKPAKAPGKKADESSEVTCNTDKVDREIKKLKEKQKELERQLRSETDEAKINDLERKLSQVTNELRQKDNDTYRRQHAVFS